ncbi:MAG: helix-turn-helix transcriptional regulator [Phycisphaeraceae bacterium]|nr:helix-turn-helix transcriptional regulator [Phycisphaeraceae bacterium]
MGAGLSQRDLAARLGKPPSYVHKCEVAERKLDPLELLEWWRGCDLDPLKVLRELTAADKKHR